LSACAAPAPASSQQPAASSATSGTPPAIAALKPPTPAVPTITDDERRSRIEKARKLMADNKIDAIFLEGGSSMF
jgi:Xaa-Pro dipeptidase